MAVAKIAPIETLAEATYGWLMAFPGPGDAFDRHVLACLIGIARMDRARPLTEALGLPAEDLAHLLGLYFPHATSLLGLLPRYGQPGEDALEEEDLRALLLEARVSDEDIPRWLAAMIARRSLESNHLWQDLGLGNRDELNQMLARHFPALFARNHKNMKWKKFFYRELCQREGVVVCKSPHCETCADYAACFDGEEGLALLSA